MLDTHIPRPVGARSFVAQRRLRLSDRDQTGRTRLDSIARLLQDAAIDDVEETGWGVPDHLWVLRSIRMDVVAPLVLDRRVEVVTWCSGVAAIAAGRRWSVTGDRGGRVEIDSAWIHLDAAQRPSRVGGFEPYTASAAGRSVSTKLLLPDPPASAPRRPWSLRSTDVDANEHVNNAIFWQAIEDRLVAADVDLARPLRASLDHRSPLELRDAVEITEVDRGEGERLFAFMVGDRVAAVALIECGGP